MKRILLDTLFRWKEKKKRKPLLIDGARQVGKTYLLKVLFGREFKKVMHIDFLGRPEFCDAFAGSLDPNDILTNLELLTGQVFHPGEDLLILDEIGECSRAITSLKYFAELTPHLFVAACGSNMGLLGSFPVGKVEQYNLPPLTFQEFLWASQNEVLIKAFENRQTSISAHRKLLEQLHDYYFTGGMPEVQCWFNLSKVSILDRNAAVSEIHANLIEGYKRDFGKAGKLDSQLLISLFTHIPAQLSLVREASVKRFKFKGVHPRKSRYADFQSAIAWLHQCRLVLENYPIKGKARLPFAAYKKDNLVKLFMFDVGLLNHMLGSSYKEITNQKTEYKGYVAENFVAQEFAAMGIEPSYSWGDARAEIEFIVSDDEGNIIPVEVKSGRRTRAKSLQSYIKKCRPKKSNKADRKGGIFTARKKPYCFTTLFCLLSIRKNI